MSPEIERFIRDQIRNQLNVILFGAAGSNTPVSETIEKLFPGMPSIPDRPIVHPYGFVSRASQGTISVTAKVGDHPGARITLGHRDEKRPSVDVGESGVYSLGGYIVKLGNGKIEFGKGSEMEVVPVGDTLLEFLKAFLDEYIAHQHVCSAPGSPGLTPMTAAVATQLKADYLDNEKILAKDGGRF